jgi:type II secretory pathway component PulM
MRQLLIEQWQKYNQKEQTFLAICGLTLSLFILYAYLWLPIQMASDKFSAEIPKKEAQLNLMKLQAAEIESKRNQFHLNKISKEDLKSSIERSAKDHGIALEKLNNQPDVAGSSLHFHIASITFDAWIKWTESLQDNQGAHVIFCMVSPNLKTGDVKVDVVLGAQN